MALFSVLFSPLWVFLQIYLMSFVFPPLQVLVLMCVCSSISGVDSLVVDGRHKADQALLVVASCACQCVLCRTTSLGKADSALNYNLIDCILLKIFF